MNLLQLKYFQCVAQMQHMTKASEVLYVSQPAISKTIKSLEAELNTTLFNRVGKHIVLNENGQILFGYTTQILKLLEEAKEDISARSFGVSNSVDVAVQIGLSCWADIVSSFVQKHPELTLNIHFQVAPPDNGTYDMLLSASMNEMKSNCAAFLVDEEFVLAVPRTHPIAGCRCVDLSAVREESFICVGAESSLRKVTDELCGRAGFKPKVVVENDNCSYIFNFIRKGIGISLVPGVTWGYKADPDIAFVKINNISDRRYIYLSWREGDILSPASRIFKEFLQNYFASVALYSA